MRLADTPELDAKGNGKKKGKKGKKEKNRQGPLNSVEKVAQAAYEGGKLSLEAYNEIMGADLDDIREERLWDNVVIVNDELGILALNNDYDVPSLCPSSSVTVSLAESNAGSSSATGNACLPENGPLEDVPLAVLDITCKAGCKCNGPTGHQNTSIDVEVQNPDGCAFLHCFSCPRLDLVEYSEGSLPVSLKAFVEDPECIVVLVLCGTCQKKPKYFRHDKSALQSQFATHFSQLCLKLEMIEKGDGVQAARVLTGREVQLLKLGEGVAFRDVDRIVRALGVDDRLSSVDMKRYAEGWRDSLRLPYVRGGLASS